MNTSLPRVCASLILFPVLGFNIHFESDSKELDRLVKHLGSSDFRARAAATKRLEAIGEQALDALDQAVKGRDLETRRRAQSVITAIENKLYGTSVCLRGHTDQVWSVSVSKDGKFVLTASADKTLRLWNAESGKSLRVFKGHSKRVMAG